MCFACQIQFQELCLYDNNKMQPFLNNRFKYSIAVVCSEEHYKYKTIIWLAVTTVQALPSSSTNPSQCDINSGQCSQIHTFYHYILEKCELIAK